jgi:hypothetical protein
MFVVLPVKYTTKSGHWRDCCFLKTIFDELSRLQSDQVCDKYDCWLFQSYIYTDPFWQFPSQAAPTFITRDWFCPWISVARFCWHDQQSSLLQGRGSLHQLNSPKHRFGYPQSYLRTQFGIMLVTSSKQDEHSWLEIVFLHEFRKLDSAGVISNHLCNKLEVPATG